MQFFVPGVPSPGGSKKAFQHPSTGKTILLDAAKNNASWRQRVSWFAAEAMGNAPPLTAPLEVRFTFLMPRPKWHYGTGRNAGRLKATAPEYHSVKPDATKLVRAAEDACTGIVWADDSLIGKQYASKPYDRGRGPGVFIEVCRIDGEPIGDNARDEDNDSGPSCTDACEE